MAKAKESKPTPSKTTKPAAASRPAAASGPTASRRPERLAADALASDVIQTGASSGNGRTTMSREDVYRLIQEAAYYKAKARGFAPGHEVQDWIEAEAEVRTRLDSRA